MVQIDKKTSEDEQIILALIDEELSHLVPKLAKVIQEVLVDVTPNHYDALLNLIN